MLLHSNIQPHQELPKEYNLDVHNPDVHNTFVFTEQDLGSYAAKNKERAKALAAGIPAHLLRQQQQKQSGESSDRGRRSGPYTRKAIPSEQFRSFLVGFCLLTFVYRENQNCWQNQARSTLHARRQPRDRKISVLSHEEDARNEEGSQGVRGWYQPSRLVWRQGVGWISRVFSSMAPFNLPHR